MKSATSSNTHADLVPVETGRAFQSLHSLLSWLKGDKGSESDKGSDPFSLSMLTLFGLIWHKIPIPHIKPVQDVLRHEAHRSRTPPTARQMRLVPRHILPRCAG